MKASIDHAGRIVLSAESGAESHALRMMFSGEGDPFIASDWRVSHFHNDGTAPVAVSFRILPQGPLAPHWTGADGPARAKVAGPHSTPSPDDPAHAR